MWMYNVLISKFGIRVPFTHFQTTILQQTEVTPCQLHLNSQAMIRGFEIICEHLNVPPSPSAFFFLFTLTRSTGGGLTTGLLSFQAIPIKKFSFFMRSPSIISNWFTSKSSWLQARLLSRRPQKGSSNLIATGTRALTHLGYMRIASIPMNRSSFRFFFKVLGKIT